ncbi:DUF2690 domain-containing protein [Actinocrispum wychmicini]|uniref:Uncharacterized protein DUF2690 n=1 Tax=Actinocrispum wychmicini TaxID=1213861 RepID=A0A4R2JSC0_9PSEU|nr:DUF2690 domain-containing protein [Actinocrispum wychmicini]TCO61987.1 uncharacterized protein DUF2690 [Actinocrispum wychmicini]
MSDEGQRRPMARVGRVASSALAALAIAGVYTAAGPAGSASASVGCHGSGCTGKDPEAQGCAADARTDQTVQPQPETYAYLRFSPACNAAWVKTVSFSREKPIHGTVYGERWGRGGQVVVECTQSTGYVAGGTVWSRMCGGSPMYEITAQ